MTKANKLIKDQMKVGVGTMVGHMAIGSMSTLPGMPAQAAASANAAHAGLSLVNIGQLGKTAMGMTDMLTKKPKGKKKSEWL